jgi:hypothetical protein
LCGILALQLAHILYLNIDRVELHWCGVAPQLY